MKQGKGCGSTSGMARHLTSSSSHGFPFGGPKNFEFTIDNVETSAPVSYSASSVTYPLKLYSNQVFSNENLRKCVVTWIVSTDTAFSAVEHPTFRRLVLCATNLQAQLFSSRTAKREIEKIHQIVRKWVNNKLLVISYPDTFILKLLT